MDGSSDPGPESRFPLIREQLTSWRLTRDRAVWRDLWFQARREAWREDRASRRWRLVCLVGLIGVSSGWIWLLVARADWGPATLLVVSLVFAVVAGSQHIRHIDRIACRLLSSRKDEEIRTTVSRGKD